MGSGAAGVVVIPAEATTGTDTALVTAVDNDTDAPDRTATVTATVTNARAAADSTTMTVTAATLTIEDDEAAPGATLALSRASIREVPGWTSTVRATLSHPSSQPSTVTVTAVSGYYTVGTDATIVIAAGSTTAASDTATVASVDDDVHQGSAGRSVTVTGTLANGHGAGTVTGAALTLEDDETLPTVALVLDPASVSENRGLSTVTATLSGKSSAAVTVTVSTASSGDYTQAGTTLTIAAGATTSAGLVTLRGTDNAVDAADRPVTVSGTAAGGNGVADPPDATLTLTDDEATATATLVLTPPSILENGEVSTVTATLSHPTIAAATLTVRATAGPGTMGNDFTLSTATTLTIAAGSTTSAGTVTVTAHDNAVASGMKTVTVSATAAGGRGVAAPSDATLTIRDDEFGLGASTVTGQATEAGGQSTFTVVLQTQPTAAVTVAVSSRDEDGNPDESEGTASPPSLTFTTESWNTAQTVTVTGVQDTIDDGTVTWKVRLDPASGDVDYNTVADVDVDVTTTDDDGPPSVTLALNPTNVSENGGISTVTARLSHPSGSETTVTVTEVSGVFRAGSGVAGTIVIPAGQTTAASDTALVTAVDNTTDAPDRMETVTATIANARAATDGTTMSVTGASLTIEDDDAAPGVTLALDPASVSENGGVSTVSATLSHPSSQPSTVTVTPVAGVYTAGSDSTIVIAAGNTTAASDTATVTAVDDDVHQGSAGRSVTVTGTLTNDHGADTVTGAALTLTDDETLPTVALVLDPASISETGGISTVTATLSGPSSAAVTVTVAAAAGTGAVVDDFTLSTATTLTIAAGATTSSGTVTVTANGNVVDSPNKSVTVSGTAVGGNGVAAPPNVTLTLEDDDATATATLVLTPSSILENGEVSTVTATLSHPTTEATTLTVAAAAGANAVAADFTLSAATTLDDRGGIDDERGPGDGDGE